MKREISSLIVLATISLMVLTGCQNGQMVSRTVPVTSDAAEQGSPENETDGAQDDVSEGEQEDGDYRVGDSDEEGAPPYSFRVEGIGYNGMKLKVKANKKLKIKFTPGVQDQTVKDTGYSPEYSQLAVFIQVENTEKATPLLSNGLSRAATSKTLDFSSGFTKTCPASSANCRQDVEITVHRPNYDHYCYMYGMYCMHTKVYETHPWNGTITVETDDTASLE